MATKKSSQATDAEETQVDAAGIVTPAEDQEPTTTEPAAEETTEPAESPTEETPADEEPVVQTPPPFIYVWDANTFLYIGKDFAQPNPLSPGEYFERANATFKEINEIKEHTRQKWNAETETWEYIPDYTQVKFYSKATGYPAYVPLGEEPDYTKITALVPADAASVWNEEKGDWEIPFDIQKERKGTWIRSVSDSKTKALETGCSQGEVSTWQRQEAGARSLKADPNAADPDAVFVKNLASTRGITLDEQIEKILVKVDFAVAYGAYVIGMQQHLEDQLKAATTVEELDAVVWPEDPEAFKTVLDSLSA